MFRFRYKLATALLFVVGAALVAALAVERQRSIALQSTLIKLQNALSAERVRAIRAEGAAYTAQTELTVANMDLSVANKNLKIMTMEHKLKIRELEGGKSGTEPPLPFTDSAKLGR
jgi:hypothetical protein